jgi:hypothetical protein
LAVAVDKNTGFAPVLLSERNSKRRSRLTFAQRSDKTSPTRHPVSNSSRSAAIDAALVPVSRRWPDVPLDGDRHRSLRRERRTKASQFVGRQKSLGRMFGVPLHATAGIASLGTELPVSRQCEHLGQKGQDSLAYPGVFRATPGAGINQVNSLILRRLAPIGDQRNGAQGRNRDCPLSCSDIALFVLSVLAHTISDAITNF